MTPSLPDDLRPEVPVTMSGTVRRLLAGLAVAFGIGLLWAVFADLHEGAIAMGEVMPFGKTKTVQHSEGGIVREILVRDGDALVTGQVLLVLDEHEAKTQVAQARTDWAARQALVHRLLAERDGKEFVVGATGELAVAAQARLFEIRRNALRSELGALARRKESLRREQEAWRRRGEALDKLAANAREEQKINQQLFETGFISRPRYLALDSQLSDRLAARGEAEAELARVSQRIADTELQMGKVKSDWLNAVLEDLRKAQDELTVAVERLQMAEGHLRRTRIEAPQEGIVKGLRYNTLGAVIPPGGVVLDVVPVADRMVVEARVMPDDIDVVRAGTKAWVRFTAYKARAHIAAEGVVIDVSPSTFHDEKSGAMYYLARVEASMPTEGAGGGVLQPGMLAEVSFSGKPRSPLRYLLDPLVQSFGRAFREE